MDPATLTAGGDNTSTTFTGVLQDGTTASLGFTKVGAGALTLAGALPTKSTASAPVNPWPPIVMLTPPFTPPSALPSAWPLCIVAADVTAGPEG